MRAILLKPGRDAQFRIAVAGRDINVIDAVLKQHLQRLIGLCLRDGAKRGSAKNSARTLMTAAPKGQRCDCHDVTPSIKTRISPTEASAECTFAWPHYSTYQGERCRYCNTTACVAPKC